MFKIENYIIDEYFFDRLKTHCQICDYDEFDKCFCNMEYEEFLEWNNSCFEKLSNEEKLWIKGLCDNIKAKKVKIMDEEYCVSFSSEKIFFNKNRKLVITCPR